MPTARELRPMIIEAVKEVIREEITSRLDDIEEKLLEITQIQDKLLKHDQHIKDIEKAMEFTSVTDYLIRKMQVSSLSSLILGTEIHGYQMPKT